jgi:hypothetical protein
MINSMIKRGFLLVGTLFILSACISPDISDDSLVNGKSPFVSTSKVNVQSEVLTTSFAQLNEYFPEYEALLKNENVKLITVYCPSLDDITCTRFVNYYKSVGYKVDMALTEEEPKVVFTMDSVNISSCDMNRVGCAMSSNFLKMVKPSELDRKK